MTVERIPPEQLVPYNPTYEFVLKIEQTVTIYDTEGGSEFHATLVETSHPAIQNWVAVYNVANGNIAADMPKMIEAMQASMLKREM